MLFRNCAHGSWMKWNGIGIKRNKGRRLCVYNKLDLLFSSTRPPYGSRVQLTRKRSLMMHWQWMNHERPASKRLLIYAMRCVRKANGRRVSLTKVNSNKWALICAMKNRKIANKVSIDCIVWAFLWLHLNERCDKLTNCRITACVCVCWLPTDQQANWRDNLNNLSQEVTPQLSHRWRWCFAARHYRISFILHANNSNNNNSSSFFAQEALTRRLNCFSHLTVNRSENFFICSSFQIDERTIEFPLNPSQAPQTNNARNMRVNINYNYVLCFRKWNRKCCLFFVHQTKNKQSTREKKKKTTKVSRKYNKKRIRDDSLD